MLRRLLADGARAASGEAAPSLRPDQSSCRRVVSSPSGGNGPSIAGVRSGHACRVVGRPSGRLWPSAGLRGQSASSSRRSGSAVLALAASIGLVIAGGRPTTLYVWSSGVSPRTEAGVEPSSAFGRVSPTDRLCRRDSGWWLRLLGCGEVEPAAVEDVVLRGAVLAVGGLPERRRREDTGWSRLSVGEPSGRRRHGPHGELKTDPQARPGSDTDGLGFPG